MSDGRRTRVLLADDHALVRSGLQALLSAMPDIEVVGVAGDGREALAAAERLQPDIVLMDISMPGLNGIDATRQVAARAPRARVVVLSVHANEEYVAQALDAGASGYVLKGSETHELAEAVRTVARGGTFLTRAMPRAVVEAYLHRVTRRVPAPVLTPRQREILQLIAEGHTSKEAAALLGVSVKTVETHRADIMRRIGASDITALVRYAIRERLITPDR